MPGISLNSQVSTNLLYSLELLQLSASILCLSQSVTSFKVWSWSIAAAMWISLSSKASLVYKVSSRTAKSITQRNPVSGVKKNEEWI